MSYYYEKTSSYLTEIGVKKKIGEDVLDWTDSAKAEIGLYPASNISYEYNPYTHTLSAATWTKYTTDSDFRAANPAASDEVDIPFPSYVGERSVTALSASTKVGTLISAKKKVFEETADRMAQAVGASLALRYEALSLSDSASTLTANLSAADSDIFSLAYDLDRGVDTNWTALDENYLASTSVVADVTAGQNLDFTNLPTSNPGVAGKLWRDSDVVKVSLG